MVKKLISISPIRLSLIHCLKSEKVKLPLLYSPQVKETRDVILTKTSMSSYLNSFPCTKITVIKRNPQVSPPLWGSTEKFFTHLHNALIYPKVWRLLQDYTFLQCI